MAYKGVTRAVRRPARQLCLICQIVEGMAQKAEQDLLDGKLDAVGEALGRIREQISGVREAGGVRDV